jgi:hypothetical protein
MMTTIIIIGEQRIIDAVWIDEILTAFGNNSDDRSHNDGLDDEMMKY